MSERLSPLSFLKQLCAVLAFSLLVLNSHNLNAQCTTPGPGEVALEIVMRSPSFATEIYWVLSDSASNNQFAATTAGIYPTNGVDYDGTYIPQHQLCVPTNTTLKLDALDSFGDGWNGGTFTARYNSTKDTVFQYSLTGSGFNPNTGATVYFQVPPIPVEINICQGDTSPAIVISDTIAADTGQYVYTWEESFDQVTWVPAPNWGGDDYVYQPVGSRTDTSYYRRTAIDGPANDTIINIIPLHVPDSLLIDSATVDSAVCSGVDDGAIQVHVSGGAAPYTYNWSDGGNGANRTGLAPGIYSVTVTDQTGCADSITVEIASTNPFTASISLDQAIECYNDSLATVSLGGFTATVNHVFLWSNGETTQTVDSLLAGTYWGRVTDTSTGCVASDTITIMQPDTLVIDSIVLNNNVSCFGGSDGSVTVYHSGGTGSVSYTFTGQNTSAVLSDPDALEADTYTVTITDANGCTAINSMDVTVGSDRAQLNGGTIGN